MSQVWQAQFQDFEEMKVDLLDIALSAVCVNWKKSRVGSRMYRGGMAGIQMPTMQMPVQMPMSMVSYPQVISRKVEMYPLNHFPLISPFPFLWAAPSFCAENQPLAKINTST